DRVGVAEIDVRLGIRRMAVAAAHDRLIVDAERGADARQEIADARLRARVDGHAALATDVDVPVGRIEPRHATFVTRWPWVDLPTHAVVERQSTHLPAVLRVCRVRLHANRVRVAKLID